MTAFLVRFGFLFAIAAGFIDDAGATSFIDDGGATSFIDDNGVVG